MSSNQILLEDLTRQDVLSRAQRHQLRRFAHWLDARGRSWKEVNRDTLLIYTHYLRDEFTLAPTSIRSHISTVRARLRDLGVDIPAFETSENPFGNRDGQMRREVFLEPAQRSVSDITIYVSRQELASLQSALSAANWHDSRAGVDGNSNARTPLTWEEARELIDKPGIKTLRGKRDTALIHLMLSTGIRSSEIPRLQVEDIRESYFPHHSIEVREDDKGSGLRISVPKPALKVSATEARRARLVPYLERDAYYALEDWLRAAGISEGPVFRGFYNGERRLRSQPIGVRTIEQILGRYPVEISGIDITVTPLTLRRTYASEAFSRGLDISILQEYLGLESSDTVLAYIGQSDDIHLRASTQQRAEMTSNNTMLESQLQTVERDIGPYLSRKGEGNHE